MHVGDHIEIRPEQLVAGGAALARVDGLPVFAANVYPGDVAVVEITATKKGFARADLVRLLTPSPLRRMAPCPIAEDCGGCDWTALRLDAQLEARRNILTESLRRIGKIDPASLPPITVHASPLNYRIRSRLHRDGGAVGFYATRSHRVVPLSAACEVVGIETAHRFGTALEALEQRGEATNASGHQTPETSHHQPPRYRDDAESEAAGPDDAEPRPDEREIWEIDGELIDDGRETKIRAGQFTYAVSTRTFFQVNRHLLATMIDLVTAHASRVKQKSTAADLYAGVGFFTVPLAAMFAEVTAVESFRPSYENARKNVPSNVKLINAPVESFVDNMRKSDFVLLDPPRAGARPHVIDMVARRTREIVCYLSCDPVTFARDAGRLTASGWRLATLDLLDLFPNTHHVETLSSFERAS